MNKQTLPDASVYRYMIHKLVDEIKDTEMLCSIYTYTLVKAEKLKSRTQ